MKRSIVVFGTVLCCALILGVAGCGDKMTSDTGEGTTTASTTAVTTTSTVAPETTVTGATTTTAVAAENAAEAEEYAVYSALIQSMYVDAGTSFGGGRPELIVIQDQTQLGPVTTLSETLEGISHAWPDLPDETLTDFETKNKSPQALKPLFSLDVEYAFFSDKEMDEIFLNSSGWDTFYEKYPHSQGILTLSRVGLDRSLDTAVVCVGNQMHWVAGQGYYVLLEKVTGRWEVRGKQMTWIS